MPCVNRIYFILIPSYIESQILLTIRQTAIKPRNTVTSDIKIFFGDRLFSLPQVHSENRALSHV